MALPSTYNWLLKPELQPLPKVIQEAIKLIGIAEKVGPGSNPTIIQWRDELNKAGYKIVGFNDDDVAWCGLFIAICMLRAGKTVVESPLWARNWGKSGTAVAIRSGGKLKFEPGLKASLGDILVFERPGGGGHVDFYIGETPTHYIGVGGNKSNRVQISAIDKKRTLHVRRPHMKVPPKSMRPFMLNSVGAVTTNEA